MRVGKTMGKSVGILVVLLAIGGPIYTCYDQARGQHHRHFRHYFNMEWPGDRPVNTKGRQQVIAKILEIKQKLAAAKKDYGDDQIS